MKNYFIVFFIFVLVLCSVHADVVQRYAGDVSLNFISKPYPIIVKQTGFEENFKYDFKQISKTEWEINVCHTDFEKNKDDKNLDKYEVNKGYLKETELSLKTQECDSFITTLVKGDTLKIGKESTEIIIVEDNLTFVVTPEYSLCDYLSCYSKIIMRNEGNTTINFTSSDLSISIPGNIYTTHTYTQQEEIMSCPTHVCSGTGTYGTVTYKERRNINEGFEINLVQGDSLVFEIETQQQQENTQYKYDVSMMYLGELHTLDPYFITTGTAFSGTYFNTSLNPGGYVELNKTYWTGEYYSQIYDSNKSSTQWLNMTWNSSIYGRELPNYQSQDIDDPYAVNMSDNVLLMHLDESSGAIIDYSGANNNGVYDAGYYSEPGVIKTGLGFDGTANREIDIAENTPMGFTDYLSYGAWFKLNYVPGHSGIMSRMQAWPEGYMLTAGSFVNIGCGWGVYTQSNVVPIKDKWYHAVCVYNGTHMRLYVDGVLQSDADAGVLTASSVNNTKLGVFYTVGNLPLNGTIDEAFVFHRALGAQEIENMYKRGVVKLNISVRACNISDCTNSTFNPFNFPLLTFNYTSRYFQYKAKFSTIILNETAKLLGVKIGYREGCTEDWIVQYTPCMVNNSQQKYYTDTHNCGTHDYLPGDNGTWSTCNYCTEDIIPTLSVCTWNGTAFSRERGYTDKNYDSCCAATNLSSDCSINQAPYNISTHEPCTIPTENNLYLTMGLLILGVIFVLLKLADRLDFFFFKDANGQEIPIMKYLVWIVSGWLLVPVANIVRHLAEMGDSMLLPSMAAFYTAIIIIMSFITSMWFLGFLFGFLVRIGWIGGGEKKNE